MPQQMSVILSATWACMQVVGSGKTLSLKDFVRILTVQLFGVFLLVYFLSAHNARTIHGVL